MRSLIPMVRNTVCALMLGVLVALLLARAVPAQAGGVVSNCSSDADLRAKLAGGGLVTFNCGSTPPILLGSQIVITSNTTLDGSNNGSPVTLSGNNATRIFQVNAGVALTLTAISLSNGNAGMGHGGCIFGFGGTVLLMNTTLQNCLTNDAYTGGGLFNFVGAATLVNSRVQNSRSGNGGGIFSAGRLTLVNSDVSGNSSLNNGGGLYVSGSADIQNSTIFSNSTLGSQGLGGGIYSQGSLTVTRSTVGGNVANPSGGGIVNYSGTLKLSNSTVSGNSALNGGAGGIYNLTGTATLVNSTLSGNSAASNGGGIANYIGSTTLVNVTLSGNSSKIDAGGFLNLLGAASLSNVTFSGNSASYAGAIGQASSQPLRLKNTIVANSPSGGNCNAPNGPADILSDGFNLSSDDTCTPYFNKTGDWNSTNAHLGPLAHNGGPTLTHMPFPPSKAIDGGSACPSTDQRGATRPAGPACDIGAVEYGATLPWLWLPLVLR